MRKCMGALWQRTDEDWDSWNVESMWMFKYKRLTLAARQTCAWKLLFAKYKDCILSSLCLDFLLN